MSRTQCFKAVTGTDYDKAIKEYFNLIPKWSNVASKVSKLLNERINNLALSTSELYIDVNELSIPENTKLFTRDGKLKANSKRTRELRKQYHDIIREEGLENFMDIGRINFIYGFHRTAGLKLESFATSEHELYYKANFDLAKRTDDLVIPISEIEYQETYLKELKKKEKN